MTNIVNINIGQAGVRIADHFWHTLKTEHAIDQPNTAGRVEAFFEEKSKGWESRSIFIDLDKRNIDKLQLKEPYLYNPYDCITLPSATSRGMYAEASYHVFPQLSDEIMDRVRKRVEGCDCLSGFLIMSSIGGGTSSGLGCRVMEQVRNTYPDKMMQTVKLFPNIFQAHPLEIYNATHAIHKEVQYSDISILFDNIWIERAMGRNGLGKDINTGNAWAARKIAQSTIPFRFSGGLNTSQRKIASNLNLFPRMHFFPFSQAPTLTTALKPDSFSLTNYYANGGKLFTLYAGVRDALASQQEADSCIRGELGRKDLVFVDWIEKPIHLSLHSPVTSSSATVIVSSYNMRQYFSDLGERFTTTFRRRGFLCWYRGCGLDEMEFTEMESNLNDLASQYTPYDYGADYIDEEDYLSEVEEP